MVPNKVKHQAEADGAMTVSIAAAADYAYVIDWLTFSADNDANGLTVTVKFGASTNVLVFYPEVRGNYHFTFPGGLATGVKNEAITVTVAGGGGTDKVAVSVGYH